MTEDKSFTLFSDSIEGPDGADTSSLSLIYQQDGSVRIHGSYAGPKAEEFWGDWDHEFWLTVPASHADAFLALLASDAFTRDGRLTYSALPDLCTAAEIPFEKGVWT